MPEATQIVEARGAITEATDKTLADKGIFPIQIITPGKGSSGRYDPAVLEQAARDRLVTVGTPMFLDHATETEAVERPGRSVRDLAATFIEDARWDGTRLIANAQVRPELIPFVKQFGPHIGVSISASGEVTEENVGGVSERVITSLSRIGSVDFVTAAGRGGKVVTESVKREMQTLLESARVEIATDMHAPAGTSPAVESAPQEDAMPEHDVGAAQNTGVTTPTTGTTTAAAPVITNASGLTTGLTPITPSNTQENTMTDTPQGAGGTTPATEAATRPAPTTPPRNPREVMEAQIREQGHQIALLRAENRARDIVTETLATGWIGDAQRARLSTALVSNLPLTEAGELDVDALRTRAQTALNEAETEAAEILSAAGVGTPRGLGALTTPATEAAADQYEAQLRESMKERGMSPAAIDIAVKGR